MRSIFRAAGAESRSWPYVAPFVLYLALMAVSSYFPSKAGILYPLRVVLVTATLLWWSRSLLRLKPSRWGASVLIGAAVFVIWIGPDLLWPSYRSRWMFLSQIPGGAAPSIPAVDRTGFVYLFWRVIGSAGLVPIIEELFWRAWLMRYLISPDFSTVPLGTYAAWAFWITAVLFASEHGQYWDVGLVAGVVYNWWMIRTRNLADCVLAHAVTNACLAAYVILAGQWQYWP
ncbi:MAG TPA: CAAX prenyl protease-related protein [Bryobacteraceae bacterium]|nr:CAAX prenyl protease-related protein [Bryobacteraceae bacterium]